jgi:Zn-dependent peptidase ImmA (M78 family)
LKKYRERLLVEVPELSKSTGIPEDRITGIESGRIRPTEQEILLLEGFFKCDCLTSSQLYVAAASDMTQGLRPDMTQGLRPDMTQGPRPNMTQGPRPMGGANSHSSPCSQSVYERYAAFKETDEFFEKYEALLSKQDRWSVHIFLCLCGHECFIYRDLLGFAVKFFPRREPTANAFEDGRHAGAELRAHLGWSQTETPVALEEDFIRIGFHAIYRKLENPDIAGLYIRRQDDSLYLLVNYDEDFFSRRFTLARLVAHAVFGQGAILRTEIDLSNPDDLRATAFAAGLLFAPKLLPAREISPENIVETALRLRVTVGDLTAALMTADAVDSETAEKLRALELPLEDRADPLLRGEITEATRKLRLHLLHRGLSPYYIELCLSALNMKLLTPGCLAVVLLTNERELPMILEAFERSIG